VLTASGTRTNLFDVVPSYFGTAFRTTTGSSEKCFVRPVMLKNGQRFTPQQSEAFVSDDAT
jgi:hypothetical protein